MGHLVSKRYPQAHHACSLADISLGRLWGWVQPERRDIRSHVCWISIIIKLTSIPNPTPKLSPGSWATPVYQQQQRTGEVLQASTNCTWPLAVSWHVRTTEQGVLALLTQELAVVDQDTSLTTFTICWFDSQFLGCFTFGTSERWWFYDHL